MAFQIVFLILLFGLINCEPVKFIDCGPSNVKSVKITPCNQEKLCPLLLNTFVEVDFEFTSTVDLEQVNEIIKGIVRGKELPFPGEKKNPCDGYLNPACPIKKGEVYTYKAKFEIKPFYPAIPIELKYSLTDKNDNTIVCIKIGAIIKDTTSKKSRRRGGSD